MLVDVGIVLSVYTGVRIFKNIQTSTKKQFFKLRQTQQIHSISKKNNSTPQVMEDFRNNRVIDETEKTYDHHLKVSTVNLAIASIRQFIYPAIAPLHLALLSYTSFLLFQRAEESLFKKRKIGNDVFSAMFGLIALSMSEYFALALGAWFYFIGCKVVAKNQRESQQLFLNAFEQLPSTVWMLKNNVEIEIPLADLQIGDVVVVNTGEVIPIDGLIVQGCAMIDQQALTGESQPAEKEVKDKVFASTIVISGKIQVNVEKTGTDTTFFKINQILNQSANFKTDIQLQGEKWADKAALPFMSMSLLTGMVLGPTAGLVILTGNFGNRIRILAPLSTLNYLKVAYKKGILVKDGQAIEGLTEVDTVLFDKTGTLTEKEPKVGNIIIVSTSYQEKDILTYAAMAESKVTHPIAKAILNKATEAQLTLPNIDDSQYQIGYGITVNVEHQQIKVGSLRFMHQEKLTLPQTMKTAITHAHTQGHTLVFVAVNHQIIGALEIKTVVRQEVKQMIVGLRQRGIQHISIVSGDHEQPTQALAMALGMDSYFANILPSEKANIVEKLQKAGKKVCFVGDGINDAIAMKTAHVSISLTGASSIATDVADVILMNGTLEHLNNLFDISNNLNTHLHNSFKITLTPTVISITGAFLFHLGFTTAIVIKNGLFFVGVGHAMLPVKTANKQK